MEDDKDDSRGDPGFGEFTTTEDANRLLDNGANPAARFSLQKTPLHYAQKADNPAAIAPLLKTGSDINADGPGGNPLFLQSVADGGMAKAIRPLAQHRLGLEKEVGHVQTGKIIPFQSRDASTARA